MQVLLAQINPVNGIHINKPRVWALTHGMIHTEPGDFIKDGTIIIREGKIDKVGRYIKVPLDAYEIDLEGAHVYAGFIDSWLKVKQDEKIISTNQHWNSKIRADYKAIDDFKIKEKDLQALYSVGITAAHVVPEKGIIKGQSDLVILSKNPISISESVAQIIEFKASRWSDREYPNSLLGTIALIRQTIIDCEWYENARIIANKFPAENEPIKYNSSLEALEKFRSNRLPMLFMTKDEHEAIRALNISDEFNLNPWILGSGFEYRRLNEIEKHKPFIILPLDFPAKPQVSDPFIALQYDTEQLKHWDLAPDNISKIQDKGLFFSFSTNRLKNKSHFRINLQRIIERGFSEDVALAALTTYPAEAMGVEKTLGKIQSGYMANLVIVDGNYFNPKSRVTSVWIEGNEYFVATKHSYSLKGKWNLSIGKNKYDLEFTTPSLDKDPLAYSYPPKKINANLLGTIQIDNKKYLLQDLKIFEKKLSFTSKGTPFGLEGSISFNAIITKDKFSGNANDGINLTIPFTAQRLKATLSAKPTKETRSDLKVHYPEGAYGILGKRTVPNAVLFSDATLWTCGPKGILEDWDILFVDGKIDKVAPDISVPRGSAMVINAEGKHITPGLIDCHSHSAASSINEGAQSVTAEVRIRDVLNADDINIYRQLGGGLTCANILHGSANTIGGQNAVIKLRWGLGPNELLFKKAPQGIKFALGENVKQANWKGTDRYPQTRMGVEQVIRDAFRAAQDYDHKWDTYRKNAKIQRVKIPPRRDLELEALSEILNGARLVHCHSYRQDEILMLTRIAEEFGFTIASFQHVLEGYKIADRIAEHGAGASTFSDWWQYKYEVIDAIPYNGTLMTRNGVNVSFNSDDAELARRLNTEAAKAIKYGGLSEEDALKLVTINPAKQLKIDQWIGSLDEGKDADIVIWDGPPLSIYSQVESTWIDGIRYWSKDENKDLEKRDDQIRKDLIQKILSSNVSSGGKEMKPNGATPNIDRHRCDQYDHIRFGMQRH
ncbi:MAG: amidohydrolase [Candidatus Marinimicrobia bacterium]|nr:amidohydrolase [Candidatus Neomarinimicrobiota bacterium]|tara:strand:+ start:696 stop:3710 length:3015 start_codon:yes stop_codon:yes gene_type:complete